MPPKSRSTPSPHKTPTPPGGSAGRRAYEAEVLPGLEPFARAEIEAAGGRVSRVGSGEIAFTAEDGARLHGLRRTVAVYRVLAFDVPRPKALLGDRDFRRLLAGIEEVRAAAPEPFEGFRFGAAGSDSSVFRRLAAAIERDTGLAFDDEEGELLLRVRPAEGATEGWEVLPRLTPRPLSAREWRACNMAGGLNATLAVAMHDVALAGRESTRAPLRYLNAMCGSGTLLIEWRLGGGHGRAVGCDLARDAVTCTHENAAAAGVARGVEVLHADVTSFPAPDGSFDLITADLPWGDAVGSHGANETLYPAFLHEAARLLVPDGVLVVLTHELGLFEGMLASHPSWRLDRVDKAFHGGHWPRMYRLVRAEDGSAAS